MERTRQSYFRERADGGGRAAQQHFVDVRSQLMAVREEIGELNGKRAEKTALLRETRSRLRVRDQQAATQRMEEIDEIIERSTFDNNHLKRLLIEKDKLAGISKSFDAVTRLEQEVEALHIKIQEKFAERDDLQSKIDTAREARDAVQASIAEHRAKIAQFDDESKALQAKLKAADQAVRDKEVERRAARDEHHRAMEEYGRKVEHIRLLERAREEVYREAEQRMIAIINARKRLEPVRERANPNDEKISAGRSLIGYLEDLIEQDQDRAEAPVGEPSGPKASQAVLTMLASFKQSTKKEKRALKKAQPAQAEPEGPKETTLTHASPVLEQFNVVAERPPTKIEDVPPLIDRLREKIRRWVDEFVIARVRLDVLPDGKVRIGLNMA